MKRTLPPLLLGIAMTAIANHSQAAEDLAPILKPILEKSKLPSLTAAVIVGDEIRGVGAAGIRKVGDKTPVTPEDKYHIGSCTKSMTATLTAILIEDGLLKWDTTIGETLGDKIDGIHTDYRGVTVEQMLAHVGGLPGDAPRRVWSQAWKNQGKMSPEEQRMIFVTRLLTAKPKYRPGSKAVYSNQGYAVVGVMLETLAGNSWEDLMRERLFQPLGMKSAGFRAPGSTDKLDQPWGHQGKKKPMAPEPGGDNPSAIAPAGAVHASIADWAKFVRYHLRRKPGGILKKKESFDKLHATLKNSESFGVGGWAVHNMPRFGGHFVQMAGSNTLWFALCWITPAQDRAFVVAANSGASSAFTTCDQVVAALMTKYAK